MAGKSFVAIVLVLLTAITAFSPVLGETGRAAYYRGGRTASGEVSGPNAYTAAHRTLPFGTKVLVTNISNGRSVTVRITIAARMVGGALSMSAPRQHANLV